MMSSERKEPGATSDRLTQISKHLSSTSQSPKPPKRSALGSQVHELLAASKQNEAANLALSVFLQPARYKPSPQHQAILSKASTSHLAIDNETVVLYTWQGTAQHPSTATTTETILLAHGFSTSTAFLTPLISRLISTTPYRIVALDHIGHGASTGSSTSLALYIRTLSALLTDPCCTPLRAIIGHSVGGVAAVMTLAGGGNGKGERVHVPRLVLLNPPMQARTLMEGFCDGHGIPRGLVEVMEDSFRPGARDVLVDGMGRRVGGGGGVRVLVVQDGGDNVALEGDTERLVRDLREGGASVVYERTKGLGHFRSVVDEGVWRLVKELVL